MALAHAILAVLVDRPCSGYDLAKRFDGSVGFFWSATHQQIYRELSKLEDQAWISSQTIPQASRPDKKLYSITELGKQQLSKWIAQPCEPSPMKDDLLVKIFAGYIVDRQTLLTELEHHQIAHQERLATYEQIKQEYFSHPEELSIAYQFQYLTLLKGMSYEAHWLNWCREAIELMKE